MKKTTFYLLSFTWGLPTTLAGCVAALALTLTGHKSKKWGYCRYFEYGDNWGGCSLGIFFMKDRNDSLHIKNHEHGHAIQNCRFGPLMPFIVSAPSFLRYWYREYLRRVKHTRPKTPYDSIWFESQATRLGTELINTLNGDGDAGGRAF